ncbi:arsenical pump-driving ATPase [Methylocystaceae bacterium]|nr:arsenical pump-driving ATPase [Methylocystaceae bacterium]
MNFLNQPPRFLFFTGKGGVGKTSIACATAINLADDGKKILLVSTDPASNIGQVFGVKIGNHITPIETITGLCGLEIDPQAAAQNYRDRITAPVRGVLPDKTVKGIEEQLSGACTTEIAAFDEFTSLLIDADITKKFDHIIFDTAPTGHTIRLLQLPGAWSDFLEMGQGDASCLGPLSGLEKQRAQYDAAVKTLADETKTRLVLVARGQNSAIKEAARTQAELAAIGINNQYLIVNGLIQEQDIENDTIARSIFLREQKTLENMPSELDALPKDFLYLMPMSMVGIESLRLLLSGRVVTYSNVSPVSLAGFKELAVSLLVEEISQDKHGLIMLMGKGGVGKTTLAAAVAVELANRGFPVHLTTSDPAAHLTETLQGAYNHLTVSRIDPHLETLKYQKEILATKGAHLDDQGRALLLEDLRSPCTEEIAVFRAFSRIIKEAGDQYVVMDTAPTGHTLLLLDAAGAYHKEVARQLEPKHAHFTTPMMQLQDSKRTKVILVTLAETTPLLEATNLQNDLRRAGIEPWAWIINNSLAASSPTCALMKIRAQNELKEIAAISKTLATRYAVVPLYEEDPIGVERLHALIQGVLPPH